jgi:hypothetical protein
VKEPRSQSSHVGRRRKSFLDFNLTQPLERTSIPSKLSFEEYANLLFVQTPLHSLRRHQNYKQIKLRQRSKIITLMDSNLYPDELRK